MTGMTGDASGAKRLWPWLAVTAAIGGNYLLASAVIIRQYRQWEALNVELTSLADFVRSNISSAHPWTIVIVMAALASTRGRPVLALLPALTLLLPPLVLSEVGRGPLCCLGFVEGPGWAGWGELVAMLLMVAIPIGAVYRPGEPIPRPAWLAGLAITAVPIVAIAYVIGLFSPTGRLETDVLLFAIAAAMIGAGIGAGVRPWFVAILPMLWLWGLVPTMTGADGWLLLIAIVGSSATPIARVLDRGRISTRPETHRLDRHELTKTTS